MGLQVAWLFLLGPGAVLELKPRAHREESTEAEPWISPWKIAGGLIMCAFLFHFCFLFLCIYLFLWWCWGLNSGPHTC
jgi:hypothetical protein